MRNLVSRLYFFHAILSVKFIMLVNVGILTIRRINTTIESLKARLEDLKVLKRSPDLLNNVKIGQGQLQLLMEQILFSPYTFWSSDLNNLMNNPSNSPVISEKKMFRQVCGSPNEWPWIKGHRSA